MTRAAIPDPTNPSTVITEDYLVGQQGAHQASYSNHYGSGVPSVTYPCMEYSDSATHLMMRVNEANNAQYAVDTLDAVRTISKTSNYTVVVNDFGKTILCNCSSGDLIITLPPASNAGSNFSIIIKRIDDSPNKVIVDAYSSETIDGQLSINLLCSDEFLDLRTDATSWYVVGRKSPNPNLLINGALDYWPEDPDFSIVGSGTAYIGGLFKLFNNLSGVTLTHSRSTRTFGDTLLPDEVTYYSTVTPSGTFSAGNTWAIVQYTDDIVQWSGKTVSYSVWMNFGSSGTAIVNAGAVLQYDTVTPGSVSVSTSYQDVATGWKKYTFTMALPTLSGHTLTGTPYLQIGINIKSEYEDAVSFTLMKCEFADKATRWIPKPLSQEIDDMSYYYHQTYPKGYYPGSTHSEIENYSLIGTGQGTGTNGVFMHYSFKKMRAIPTCISYQYDSSTQDRIKDSNGDSHPVTSFGVTDSKLNYINTNFAIDDNRRFYSHVTFDARF